MNRIEILQKIIDKKGYKTYLEIGACGGVTLLSLKNLELKIAVDVEFKYPLSVFQYSKLRDNELYFEDSSDKFFEKFNEEIELIFIDGAHSYCQVIKDVKNSLKILNKDGLIMLHDCNPPHKAAAIVADSILEAAKLAEIGWNGEWCGDVWKIVQAYPDMVVLDCDYGLGLLKKKNEHMPFQEVYLGDNEYSVIINDLTYADLEKNRVEMLKLKPVEYLDEFFK